MMTNKDLAIQKIEKEFEKLSNLILEQLLLLQKVINQEKDVHRKRIFQKLADNEEKIDRYEVQLDEQIIKVIVLYHPIATDLRRLFAIYHMTINLERVGDLVVKITNTCIEITDSNLLSASAPTLQNMLKITSKMVNRALLSFINNDAEFATWTINKDMEFDELNRKLLKKNIKSTGLPRESQHLLNSLVDVRSIISSLERIGDNATNIAESSLYFMTGSIMRHQNPKPEK
ncbi:MAG: phosphate uptake regulator PhoU [Bacteroidota bacterium]